MRGACPFMRRGSPARRSRCRNSAPGDTDLTRLPSRVVTEVKSAPMILQALAILLSAALSAQSAPPQLPPWCPSAGIFTINPDQLVVEDFGADSFKVAKGKSDDYDEVDVKGRHWSTSVYPTGPSDSWKWDGEAAWTALRATLEKQGFTVVYLKHDPGRSVDATLRKGAGAQAAYVEIFFTKDDAFSNSLKIVEPAAAARTLTLTPPAAQPEALDDSRDFPYLTALAGAKLLNTTAETGPLDVTTAGDKEPHLVGSGTITKLYEGPPRVSSIDFVNTYGNALRAAGWTVVDKTSAIVAHYSKNGREIWIRLSQEGADRWDVTVADVGSGLRARLEKDCAVALYGVTFDFNKATLRPDADPVLQQVLATLEASPALSVEIGGHTDNVGTKAYNEELSQQRADSVKAWLVAHGVAASRLTTKGYGDSVPVVPNTSDANRARNRRVELKKPNCG